MKTLFAVLVLSLSVSASANVCKAKLTQKLPELGKALKDTLALKDASRGPLIMKDGDDLPIFRMDEYVNRTGETVEVYILAGKPNGYYSNFYAAIVKQKSCTVHEVFKVGDSLDD